MKSMPRLLRRGHRVFLADQDRVVEVRFFRVGLYRLQEIDGNTDNLQIVAGMCVPACS